MNGHLTDPCPLYLVSGSLSLVSGIRMPVPCIQYADPCPSYPDMGLGPYGSMPFIPGVV